MLDITNDIQSLTTFRRRSGDFMKQLRKTRRPVVLTVKGMAAAIVQDAEAYQRLLDIAARAELDLVHLYRETDAEHSDAALKWYRGFKEAILRLEEGPHRCPVTHESNKFRH
ncbi:MAG: type II toxin-antitoxin system Phd/YefM family antitoxin [Acidobacteriota bacterium]|nr:type II toxin-antitoxin system Phd/YefM family antitoxin [Acidobacteriota bacterium]